MTALFALLLALPEPVATGGGATPWGAIVVHKSGEASGSAASIDRFQRETLRDPDGIDHHFVITNGNGGEDGAVEVTAPWVAGKKTSHLFRAGGLPPAISICLVGAYDAEPTVAQRAALAELVAALAERFSIGADRVLLHGEIEKTQCPGALAKRELLVSAKLASGEGPPRLVVEAAAGRATLFSGEAAMRRFTLARAAAKAPAGSFRVCRKDEGGAFGRTLVLSWPTAADVEIALRAGRIGADDARRLRDEIAAGRCPSADTPLGGEIGIHATTAVDEEAGCLHLEPRDLDAVYGALPLGALVEISR